MIKEKMEYKEIPVLQKITCDICKKEFDAERDWQETEEFFMISKVCGFGSVFGDGNAVTLDVCQHCFKKVFGSCIRIRDYGDVQEKGVEI